MPEVTDHVWTRFRDCAKSRSWIQKPLINSRILQSYRREIVGARLLPKICDAWEKPREDFQQPTLWRLLNAFTEAYKTRFRQRPNEAAQETIRLQRFLEEKADGRITTAV